LLVVLPAEIEPRRPLVADRQVPRRARPAAVGVVTASCRISAATNRCLRFVQHPRKEFALREPLLLAHLRPPRGWAPPCMRSRSRASPSPWRGRVRAFPADGTRA